MSGPGRFWRGALQCLIAMRVHAILFGILLSAFGGWLIFGQGDGAPDVLRARDRLVASAAVVRFDDHGVGGYRFTSVPGVGWVWERTTPDGGPYPDAIVFNGTQHLLRLADNCYIERPDVQPPLIPGITTSPRLTRQRGLQQMAARLFAYNVPAVNGVAQDALHPVPAIRVTENLASIEDVRVMRASTDPASHIIWGGDYTVSPASAEEVAHASALISSARVSDYAELLVRQRVVGTVVGSVLLQPSSIVVARDCADSPAELGSASSGGQIPGLRATPALFSVSSEGRPAFTNALATRISIGAPVELLHEQFLKGSYGDVSITKGVTVIVNRGPAGGLAVQVLSCTYRPWFPC